jgi:hypothetical protein
MDGGPQIAQPVFVGLRDDKELSEIVLPGRR